ncbi:hypothetical protein [Victivallis vadensis]|uniref:hypothetical protein n=1 Tax=Victivallis vadensis TaxID=172901 RepID=UPI003AF5C911
MFLHQADSVDIFKIRNRFISNGEYGYFNLHALVSRRNSFALSQNGCFTALSVKNPDRSFPGTGFNTLFRHSRICRREFICLKSKRSTGWLPCIATYGQADSDQKLPDFFLSDRFQQHAPTSIFHFLPSDTRYIPVYGYIINQKVRHTKYDTLKFMDFQGKDSFSGATVRHPGGVV